MIAVITGDIVNSRKQPATQWLPLLKKILSHYGNNPSQWEIYRGDSFQLTISPDKALLAAVHIKAGIKKIKNLDVRIAIGLGELEHKAKKVSESNGSAFVRSGEGFDTLKKQNMGIFTGNPEEDELFNLLLDLALLSMNNWSTTVAEAIQAALENPAKNQTELAEMLGKSQSSLSEALKRGAYDEISRLEEFYQKRINRL
ncbi:SatD family (SatD) [Salinimicrobium catena]|uniref:SatD family (SatD) n=1 Tax=Salinimicrobium catena TaxID=390640 RepID=A0A1H5N2Y5_9FLAO|nr:transcriptional regulator [Salinimicrobium catena]SDL35242.1 SatD family (SatD) [Salinimicrobium catena]SEE95810.1 SatD family (SatD) [Salinimicrobium catena]